MKSYSDSVTQVLAVAQGKEQYEIIPSDLDETKTHATTPHPTRVGYMNRLCKAGLLEKKGDPKLEQYALTQYGLWVHHMNNKGWKYKDSVWSNGNISLDSGTVSECIQYNIVPIVSDLLEK